MYRDYVRKGQTGLDKNKVSLISKMLRTIVYIRFDHVKTCKRVSRKGQAGLNKHSRVACRHYNRCLFSKRGTVYQIKLVTSNK